MRKSTLLVATACAILIFSFAIGQQPRQAANGQEAWEYKVLKIAAGTSPWQVKSMSERERAGIIEIRESTLNRLGLEGYELISSVVEFETVWPNFGDREYVTGLQPNVRTSAVVMTFKRKTTKKNLSARLAIEVANESKIAKQKLEAMQRSQANTNKVSPEESKTTTSAPSTPRTSQELIADNAKFWQLNGKVALLDGVIPNELASKEFPVVGAVGPLSRIEPGARILGIELSEEEGMLDVRNWDEIRTLLKRATSKKIRVKWMNSGGGSTYNFAIEIGGPSKQG